MVRNHDEYTKEIMRENVKKLLVSAWGSVAASNAFKQNLLLRLRSEVSKLATNISRELTMNADLENNLSRLMVSASVESSAVPGFKDRLLYQLMAESEKTQRKSRSLFLVPALAGAVALVIVIGALIYPNFWAMRDIGVRATVSQGAAVITQTKPLFFIWGSRIVQSSLTSGTSVSLAVGNRIATDPNALVVLALFNESSVRLYPSSELTISELNPNAIKESCGVRLKLDAGRITSKINKLNYILETPAAETNVVGTAFRTEVIASDHTYLATDEGTVQLTMEGNTVQVSEGEELHAIKRQPLVVTRQGPPLVLFEKDNFTKDKKLSSPLTMHARVYPEAMVKVNGQPAVASIYGWFSITLKFEPGRNDIIITVISPSGKTTNYKYPITIQNP